MCVGNSSGEESHHCVRLALMGLGGNKRVHSARRGGGVAAVAAQDVILFDLDLSKNTNKRRKRGEKKHWRICLVSSYWYIVVVERGFL